MLGCSYLPNTWKSQRLACETREAPGHSLSVALPDRRNKVRGSLGAGGLKSAITKTVILL
jgi:hypothetical protein